VVDPHRPARSEGRKLYEYSTADAKRLLSEAGYPNGFKTQVEVPGVAYGPDFLDAVQVQIKNWKDAGSTPRSR